MSEVGDVEADVPDGELEARWLTDCARLTSLSSEGLELEFELPFSSEVSCFEVTSDEDSLWTVFEEHP